MTSPVAHRRRILVVDDEPTICQFCQRVLLEAGFDVDVATNGKVAQSMISKADYDLFLVDIKMPEMDGKELYMWLQGTCSTSEGKVIFTTGSAIGQDTESFLQSASRPVLHKP
jgi:DNA-binding response OmpR family regulator